VENIAFSRRLSLCRQGPASASPCGAGRLLVTLIQSCQLLLVTGLLQGASSFLIAIFSAELGGGVLEKVLQCRRLLKGSEALTTPSEHRQHLQHSGSPSGS